MKAFGKTDVGRVRRKNEDNYAFGYYDDGNCWAVVCDGMGGVSGGEVASSICVERVSEALKRGYRKNMTVKSIENILTTAIIAANAAVFKESKADLTLKGMGTTVVATIVLGDIAVIAHVGDSRAYLLNDEITPITKDHSYVQLLVDTGKITELEAAYHPDRNVITRAVGIENYVDVDINVVDINSNDKLLLCTDGLNGYVADGYILKLVDEYGDLAVEKLVEAANDAGGRDNITVVVIG